MTHESTQKFVRAHLAVTLVLTCLTAWFSYAYFHDDEYFQILEFARSKLGHVEPEQLPWEHARKMRPWLQPFSYWLLARGLNEVGVRNIFDFAFVCRLLGGLANVGALALFLRTTLPWMKTDEERRLHVRVATLTGFLPYLFVRTSSESSSMAALMAGFALLLEGSSASDDEKRWTIPTLDRPWRASLVGLLFGLAFELRFQSIFFTLGLFAWVLVIGKPPLRTVGAAVLGGIVALALGSLVDRWGYGAWTFPAWSYFTANIVEGQAKQFGVEPPMAYFWLLPANLFMPLIVALLVAMIVAWVRCPRHPSTWASLPFFVVHNFVTHKEERFLFPLAILATGFVTMALGPSFGRASALRVTEHIAAFGWSRRSGRIARLLAVASLVPQIFLAFVPLGWNHHVRFMRFVNRAFGDELHAMALLDVEPFLPAFHPLVYDVDRNSPEEIVRRLDAGTARSWLITDQPVLRTGTSLDARAVLVFSELPTFRFPGLVEPTVRLVDAYNARARPPLRRLRFRSLYRLDPPRPHHDQ